MRGHALVLLTNFDSMLSVECRYALRSPSRHLHRFDNARSMVLLAASFEPSSIAFSIVIFAECEHNFFIAFHYIHFNRQFNVFTLFGFIRSIDIGKCSALDAFHPPMFRVKYVVVVFPLFHRKSSELHSHQKGRDTENSIPNINGIDSK